MNKATRLVILIVVAVLALVTFIFLLTPERYRWYESLRPSGNDPYDLGIFTKLLKENNYGGSFDLVTSPLTEDGDWTNNEKPINYFIIDNYYFPDTIELAGLKSFIENGNTVFLSARFVSPMVGIALQFGVDSVRTLYGIIGSENQYDVPDSISNKYDDVTWSERDSLHDWYKRALTEKIENERLIDTAFRRKSVAISLNNHSETSSLFYQRRQDSVDYMWRKVKLVHESAKRVATYDDENDLIMRYPQGDGNLYVCATPMIFSNLHMLREDHFAYCNALLSQLDENDILFDKSERVNRDVFRPKATLGKSPLSFILSKPALRWAWYTLLFTALLFLLFRSKRSQRVVPILKPNLNTTLAYAKMLGSLQLKEKNNTAKAQEMTSHFLQQLRNRKRWSRNEVNTELREVLIKLAPELEREIQIVVHLSIKSQKGDLLTDQDLVRLFNYSQNILAHI